MCMHRDVCFEACIIDSYIRVPMHVSRYQDIVYHWMKDILIKCVCLHVLVYMQGCIRICIKRGLYAYMYEDTLYMLYVDVYVLCEHMCMYVWMYVCA